VTLSILLALAPLPSSACPVGADGDLLSGSPAAVSLDGDALAGLIGALRAYDIHGLVISRNCRIVVEMYMSGVTREQNHTDYSVTKSVMVTLAGTLLAKIGRAH